MDKANMPRSRKQGKVHAEMAERSWGLTTLDPTASAVLAMSYVKFAH